MSDSTTTSIDAPDAPGASAAAAAAPTAAKKKAAAVQIRDQNLGTGATAAPAGTGGKNDTTVDADGFSGRKMVVTVHTSKESGGNMPVFIGVNGRGFHFPRGTAVVVPEEVVESLNNAMETSFEHDPSGTPVARYSFAARPYVEPAAEDQAA